MSARSAAVARLGGAARSQVGARGALAAGCTILFLLVLAALLAPLIAPADPLHQDLSATLAAPGSDGHLLGTDHLGRDTLSRVLYAARTDLLVAAGAVLCPFLIGTAAGTVAGYAGGWVDTLLMRLVDVVFAFPVLVLLIALVFVLGPGVLTMIVAITLIGWVSYARLARAAVRGEREKDYVLAARVGGLSHARIICRHLLPNVLSQQVVYALADVVIVLITITSLGFLGLGVPPPAADWGTMIAEAQPYMTQQWWLAVVPGVALLLTGLGFSLVADGLAARLDAR